MTHYPLKVFTGSANRPLAQDVAAILGQELGRCTITHLPDTEVHVIIDDLVREHDIFLIQSCSAPVNDNLVELLLLIDAFRRASAHSITVVIPYFPYARQERMARGREAISARVVATNLEAMGATRVIYVDIHAPAIQGFFTVPVDPLTALPALAQHFRGDYFQNAVIVSPDVGRAKMAGRYAEWLGLPLVIMHKRRDHDSVKATHVVGDIQGKIPIVIDDIIAGGSIFKELPKLIDEGAAPEIYLAITHPVLVGESLTQLAESKHVKELVVTNTIYLPPEKRQPKVRIVSIAPLLADAIRRIHEGITVGPLVQPY